MSTTSPNIGLNIPVGTDTVDFDKFFIQNFNAIDGQFASGTTANRPSSPKVGQRYFNTDSKVFDIWDGTAWSQLVNNTYSPVNVPDSSLLNGWVNNKTNGCKYWKDGLGIVHFYFEIKSGGMAANTVIFNFPAGYIPDQEYIVVGYCDGMTTPDVLVHVTNLPVGELKLLRAVTSNTLLIIQGSYRATS